MAITLPLARGLLADRLKIASVSWKLRDNQQYAGLGSGEILAVDLGPRLWEAEVVSAPMYHAEAMAIQALIESLDGAINAFYLYNPLTRIPAAYKNSGMPAATSIAQQWDFATTVEGWTGTTVTLSAATPGVVTVTGLAANNWMNTPSISIDGSKYTKVRARIRRTSGSGVWQGQCYFANGNHIISSPHFGQISAPSVPGTFSEIEWDMANVTDWMTGGPITSFRLDLWGNGDVWEVDWVRVYSSTFSGDAAIASLNANNKAMTIDGLPASYVISQGDMLHFDYGTNPVRRALHRILETVTADGSGVSPSFEVRPHIRAGAAVDAVVSLVRPSAKVLMVPGTFEIRSNSDFVTSVISFRAMQTLR